jgi:hypothetical protein
MEILPKHKTARRCCDATRTIHGHESIIIILMVIGQNYLSFESALDPLLNDEPRGTNLTTAGVLAFSAASVESSFFASSSFELLGAGT